MIVQTRSVWGARAPKWNPGSVSPSLGVYLHYNSPPVSSSVANGDYDSVRKFLQSIQRYHIDSNGWPDIAYSFAVDATGRVWELRGWGVAQAATRDWNWKSHSIFLPLGGDQRPTPAQIAGCQTVIAEHNRRYGTGFVKGHQQAPNKTSCPGPHVLELVNAGAFNPTSTAPRPTPTPTPNPAPQVPVPVGVDITVNKPSMMQEPDGTVWMYYTGTPDRVHIKSPADVAAFRYMGIEYKVVDAKTAAFFRRYSKVVVCG